MEELTFFFFLHKRDKRDKIYMDNIEQTASLFDKFKDCVSSGTKLMNTIKLNMSFISIVL